MRVMEPARSWRCSSAAAAGGAMPGAERRAARVGSTETYRQEGLYPEDRRDEASGRELDGEPRASIRACVAAAQVSPPVLARRFLSHRWKSHAPADKATNTAIASCQEALIPAPAPVRPGTPRTTRSTPWRSSSRP